MIRGVITLLFVILFLLVTSPLLLALWLWHKASPDSAWRVSHRILSWAVTMIQRLVGVRLVVRGLENIPRDRALIYMGNHRSFFDVLCTLPLLPGPTSYIGKKEFSRIPLLSTWMSCLDVLFLDRKNTREGLKMVLEAIGMLGRGHSIFIYPEGSRSKTDSMLPFHGGSFKIAGKSGAPIIPVAISNSSRALEDQFPRLPWTRKSTLILTFGPAIETADLDRQAIRRLPDQVRSCLAGMLLENGEVWQHEASTRELREFAAGKASPSNPGVSLQDAGLSAPPQPLPR